MESEKSDREPTVIVQTPPAYTNNQERGSWKQSSNVRLLIIAGAAILVTVAIVTGFVLGFRYHTSSTKDALTSTDSKQDQETVTTDDGQETIDSEDHGLTKLYTIRTEDGVYQVLYDYNKNLRVMKRASHCIVTPMNSSESDPQTEYENNQAHQPFTVTYKRDNVPIRDSSFLGKKGQELCEDMLVYWGLPACPGDDGAGFRSNATDMEEAGRQKRSGSYVGGHDQYHYYGCAAAGYTHRCVPNPCLNNYFCAPCVERYLLTYYSSTAKYHYHCLFNWWS